MAKILQGIYIKQQQKRLKAKQIIGKDNMSLQDKLDNNLIGKDIDSAEELILTNYDNDKMDVSSDKEIGFVKSTDTANIAVHKVEDKLTIFNNVVNYLVNTNRM